MLRPFTLFSRSAGDDASSSTSTTGGLQGSALARKIMSDFIIHTKYARYLPDKKRREHWDELVDRNMEMHIRKYPELAQDITDVYNTFVRTKRVLPSMRSFQFAGRAVEVNNARIFNCAFMHMNVVDAFSEACFLLLGGSGVGFSVQRRHVDALPAVQGVQHPEGHQRKRRFLVADSIEGWADAVKVLVESYFYGKREVDFDFREIRPKGAMLVTAGGKAPGPEPLRDMLTLVTSVFENALQERGAGTRLKPIEVHDIMCHIAQAVKAGGIRRSAMISLFDHDDLDMLTCKSGEWWVDNNQRQLANNSVVLLRDSTTEEQFRAVMKKTEISRAGEPGIFWTNDLDLGVNPCVEISLRNAQFCNLTEINGTALTSQEDLNAVARAGAILGTLQASYTDFHYLRPLWRETTEDDALLGVSITGIADENVLGLDFTQAGNIVREVNAEWAKKLGIKPASRTTCGKPSGTTSLVLGTSSGVHAWWDEYYIRRVTLGKNEAVYKYLAENHPELVEDNYYAPATEAKFCVPMEAPKGAILRSETAVDTLNRVKLISDTWIRAGYNTGDNQHNQSCTINVKDHEWPEVVQWMWDNREAYNGISVLPYDGGSYKSLPHESITQERYDELLKHLKAFDLTKVVETEDTTDLSGEAACSGGACEVR